MAVEVGSVEAASIDACEYEIGDRIEALNHAEIVAIYQLYDANGAPLGVTLKTKWRPLKLFGKVNWLRERNEER